MITKVCPDCQQQFSYTPNPNFPDKRKYCDACGEKRKAAYEAKQNQPQQPVTQPVQNLPPQAINTTEGISEVKHVFQSSYEFGKAGDRHTIKYFDLKELQEKLDALVGLRLPQLPQFE